jgi:hypothetical protein
MELQTEAINKFAPTKFEGIDFFNSRMWIGGPLRQMATSKVAGTFIPFAKTVNGLAFAGRYVCDQCLAPCQGVRRQSVGRMSGNRHSGSGIEWLCDACIKARRPEIQSKTSTLSRKSTGYTR